MLRALVTIDRLRKENASLHHRLMALGDQHATLTEDRDRLREELETQKAILVAEMKHSAKLRAVAEAVIRWDYHDGPWTDVTRALRAAGYLGGSDD